MYNNGQWGFANARDALRLESGESSQNTVIDPSIGMLN